MNKVYNKAAVVEMLRAGFNAESLRLLAVDHFDAVRKDWVEGITLTTMILDLVDYADRIGQMPILLEDVRRANRYQYDRHITKILKDTHDEPDDDEELEPPPPPPHIPLWALFGGWLVVSGILIEGTGALFAFPICPRRWLWLALLVVGFLVLLALSYRAGTRLAGDNRDRLFAFLLFFAVTAGLSYYNANDASCCDNCCPEVDLISSRDRLRPGEKAILTVDYEDPEDDPPEFTWSATERGLADEGAPHFKLTNEYVAPAAAAGEEVRITLFASDNACGQKVSDYTDILVLPVTPTPSATPSRAATATPTASPSASSTSTATEATRNGPTRTPTATSTPTRPPELRLRATSDINVRAGPGTVYAIVGRLMQGQEAIVLASDEARTWYNVELLDGRRGWVHASVVEMVDEAAGEEIPVALTIPAPPLATTAPPTRAITSSPTSSTPGGGTPGDDEPTPTSEKTTPPP